MSATITPIKPGLWRNGQGVEMNVFYQVAAPGDYLVLGRDIWEGVVLKGVLGPTRYLLTAESLSECGYEFIEEEI